MLLYDHRHHEDYYCTTIKDREPRTATLTFTQLMSLHSVLLYVHRDQNDSCIKMGSDESHFNVSLIVRDKVSKQCPQTTTF